ncbi:hypothetical protein P167DRAFT_568913, partial [Morchella conica CCBAS932]
MGEERSEEESVECMRRLDMALSVRRERCAMRHSESVAGGTTRWRAMGDEGWGCRKELMVVVVFFMSTLLCCYWHHFCGVYIWFWGRGIVHVCAVYTALLTSFVGNVSCACQVVTVDTGTLPVAILRNLGTATRDIAGGLAVGLGASSVGGWMR